MQKIILLLVGFVFLMSCKKEESPNPTNVKWNGTVFPGPKAELIIAKDWKLTNKTVVYDNGLPDEDFSNVPDCVKDNLMSFEKSRQYSIDEAVDVCPNEPQTTTYNWRTEDEEQTLVLNNRNWQLVTVTATTLVIKQVSKSDALTAITTETYTAQ